MRFLNLLDDLSHRVARKDEVLQWSKPGADINLTSVIHTEIYTDLGVVINKSRDLALVIRQSIEFEPERLRVI